MVQTFAMLVNLIKKNTAMLIIIGALFYALGIIVGRNWEKITRE